MLKTSFWLFFLPCYICIRDYIAIVITVYVILCNSYLIKKVLFHYVKVLKYLISEVIRYLKLYRLLLLIIFNLFYPCLTTFFS